MRTHLTLIIVFALTTSGQAAVHTVGNDLVACDFTDLSTALSAASNTDTLQLDVGSYIGVAGTNFNVVSKSLTIKGGYLECSGVRTENPSTLNGMGGDSVVETAGSGSHFLLLDQLVITGGNDDFDDGGGIGIVGDFDVTLLDVGVVLNDSERGGGVHIDGTDGATLFVGEGSRIGLNEASIGGGGIYCQNGAVVTIFAPAVVDENTTAGNGAGIYADDCSVTLTGDFPYQVKVTDNFADGHGGGFYATAGAQVIGDGRSGGFLTVGFNGAGLDAATGYGGAAYSRGGNSDAQSLVELAAAQIINNFADEGGAFYATDFGTISLIASSYPCSHDPCQELIYNQAELGGAATSVADGEIRIRRALVYENGFFSGDAPVAYVDGSGFFEVESSFVVQNGIFDGSGTAAIMDLGGGVRLEGSTFADNYGIDQLLVTEGSFEGTGLISWNNGNSTFDASTINNATLDCAVLPAGDQLPAGAILISHLAPIFRDPSQGTYDYHLKSGSGGIDLCDFVPPIGYPLLDIDGQSRSIGVAGDAGGDESEQPIFADGFESGDFEEWSSTTG